MKLSSKILCQLFSCLDGKYCVQDRDYVAINSPLEEMQQFYGWSVNKQTSKGLLEHPLYSLKAFINFLFYRSIDEKCKKAYNYTKHLQPGTRTDLFSLKSNLFTDFTERYNWSTEHHI